MCDDLTKQEILFFTVVQAHPAGLSEDEIFDKMSELAVELEWPEYLNAVPRSLNERLIEARDRAMIQKYSPLRWRPSPNAEAYVRHLIERYLDESEAPYDKLMSVLGDRAYAAG